MASAASAGPVIVTIDQGDGYDLDDTDPTPVGLSITAALDDLKATVYTDMTDDAVIGEYDFEASLATTTRLPIPVWVHAWCTTVPIVLQPLLWTSQQSND